MPRPPLPPPVGGAAAPPPPTGRARPRWGAVDALPMVGYLALLVTFAILAGNADSDSSGSSTSDAVDTVENAAMALFIGNVIHQFFQIGWPWIVSKWKGLGMGPDWRLRFKAEDIGWGIALAVGCTFAAAIVRIVTTVLVGLDDDENASNTSILTDNDDSLWIIGIIATVVIGAPIVEEVLFRGFFLRVFERSFGLAAGAVLSTVIFAIPHLQVGASIGESIVLVSSIAAVGAVLCYGAIRFDRLGPCIIGHALFNLLGTVVALST